MRHRTRALLTASVLTLVAAPANALDSCKAKIHPKDGIIRVSAKNVSGTLRWGESYTNETKPFWNDSLCVAGGTATNCEPGPSAADRITPPELCTIFLRDSAGGECFPYLKKCVPGVRPTCPAEMVKVGSACVDRYEASVWDSPFPGGTRYGAGVDDYPCNDDGNDCFPIVTAIYAASIAGVAPSTEITWFQAAAACRNAGKRLATNQEWQLAALGAIDPGPADNGLTECNVFTAGAVVATGSRGDCFSRSGAFDIIGNVWEWTGDWTVRATTGCSSWSNAFGDDISCLGGDGSLGDFPDAVIRGGDYNDGPGAGVFAVGSADPTTADASIGFRCAR